VPAELTREELLKIAALANLELDASELDVFGRQLGDILAYVTELQQADTTGVPPTASVVTRHATDRPHDVAASLDIEHTLPNAPDADRSRAEGGFFKVPRVIR
jgi:aspartyl-tRNA(Asn)/glutamyl-tRNA(Gln) amidotransferase subunit C